MAKLTRVKTMPGKPAVPVELLVRLHVVDPPPGVPWALQLGRTELLSPVSGHPGPTFEVTIHVVVNSHGDLDFRGPAVQGPRGGRFIYLSSGVRAGQGDSSWDRRAKVPLEGLRERLGPVAAIGTIKRASARIAGTARDGGPACASVPLLGAGWVIER